MEEQPKSVDQRAAPEEALARLEDLIVSGAVLSYDRTRVAVSREDLRTVIRLLVRLRVQLEAIEVTEEEPVAAETARFALAMFSRGFRE